jgi:8-oxo-dGTP diphosphatase
MIDVTCAIIHNEKGEIFVAQRSQFMDLPLKWEFPGGKIELNETPEECLIREIKEELDIKITVIESLPSSKHSYPTITINLIPFICKYIGGEILLREHVNFQWLNKNDLLDLDWAEADVPIVNYYLNRIHATT